VHRYYSTQIFSVFREVDIMPDSAPSREEKIKILLEEYKTLRAEVSSRTGYGFQSKAVAVTLMTWLAVQVASASSWGAALFFFLVGLALMAAACLFYSVNVRDIWAAGVRLRELEHEINSRAGEHLLCWERRFGGSRISYVKGLWSVPKPLAKNELPPLDESLLPPKN
jgi:hypothetical protein